MTDAVDETLKSLPQRPGVYRMIGETSTGERLCSTSARRKI